MALSLNDLGWNKDFADAFRKVARPGWLPARLIVETKINFTALTAGGNVYDAVVSGKLWHDAESDADLPAVGDWVAIEPGKPGHETVIRALLPRKTCFSRKQPGRSSAQQVIATNIDAVVIVTDPGSDYNLRRMERYFALVRKSGADAIVLVNKCDEHPALYAAQRAARIQELCPEATVHCISALKGNGLKLLKKELRPGRTLTIVGSSGVGKSTLVNQLLGEEWLWTGEVNPLTGKGRHTTVSRELVVLPGGGMLVDNPGMREIQMWTDEASLRESFADLDAIASECQYADCRHGSDAGCALRAAVASGKLSPERLDSFLNLGAEIAKLDKDREKRQMTTERVAKRNHKIKARNREDRIDIDRHHNPNRHH